MRPREWKRVALVVTLAAVSSGCGVGTKRVILAEALDDRDDREEYFEAILQVLDENPDYVDEFFVQARGHEITLDRFIQNAANNLDEEELATMTAKHLAGNPPGLRQMLIQSLLASEDKPEARAAIASAIGAEVDLATGILTDDPEVVRETLLATVRHVSKKREARRAFVQAMYAASPVLASILAGNPKVLTKMFENLSQELRDDPELIKKLLGEVVDGDDEKASDEDEKVPTSGD